MAKIKGSNVNWLPTMTIVEPITMIIFHDGRLDLRYKVPLELEVSETIMGIIFVIPDVPEKDTFANIFIKAKQKCSFRHLMVYF